MHMPAFKIISSQVSTCFYIASEAKQFLHYCRITFIPPFSGIFWMFIKIKMNKVNLIYVFLEWYFIDISHFLAKSS